MSTAPPDLVAPGPVALEDTEGEPVRVYRPWFSGWCGPGPVCRDDVRETNKVGETVRRCLYVAENGAKAARTTLRCACSCHTDPDRAGQAA